jgi:hypothetical protein
MTTLGTQDTGRKQTKHNRETYTDEGIQEWTIQKNWQHWEIKHWTKTNKTQQRNL